MGKEVAHLLVNPALTIHRKTLKLVFVALLLRYFLLSISAPVDATPSLIREIREIRGQPLTQPCTLSVSSRGWIQLFQSWRFI